MVNDKHTPAAERQLMVKMTCQSCVKSVRGALEPLQGVDCVKVIQTDNEYLVYCSKVYLFYLK